MAPPARLNPGGRRVVLYNNKQHLPDASADQERLLAAWQHVVDRAQAAAPRFLLRTGDLLCLDNYRVAHGREPYDGEERLLHRLWTWSDAAFGVPDPDAADAAGAARDRELAVAASSPAPPDAASSRRPT
jgi:alpha-ketoglutarate-dependent taurine dioxygenase